MGQKPMDPSAMYETVLSHLPKPIVNADPSEIDAHLPQYEPPQISVKKRRNTSVTARSLPATGLNVSDYHPGPSLSPVKVDSLQNSYWGSLPVITGGESYFPQGVLDAKRAYADAKDYQAEQERNKIHDALFVKYAMEKGDPNYTPVLQKFYSEHIGKFIDDEFDNNPNALHDFQYGDARRELDDRYAIYDGAVRSTTMMRDSVNDAITASASGKELDKNSVALMTKYLDGKAADVVGEDGKVTQSIIPLVTMHRDIRSWGTMEQVLSPVINDAIGKDIQTALANGIDVKMEDGTTKHLTQAEDGDQIINEVRKGYMNPEKMKFLMDYANARTGITLNPDYTTENYAAFITSKIPGIISEQFHTINANKNNMTVNINDKPQSSPNLNATQTFKVKGTSGGKEVEFNITGVNGIGVAPKEISVNTAQLKEHNYDANFTGGTTKGNFVGAYEFNVDKNGHIISDGSKGVDHASRFAVIQKDIDVEYTEDELKGMDLQQRILAMTNKKKITKTYYVPFDAAIQNAVKELVPSEENVNEKIVTAKDAYTDVKKQKIGTGKHPLPAGKKATETNVVNGKTWGYVWDENTGEYVWDKKPPK